MRIVETIRRAMIFAQKAHGDQVRKYTGEPYWYHPLNVHYLILDMQEGSASEDTLVAAILHDVLEDTDASEASIREAFGQTVLDLVLEVTDVSSASDGNRAHRKQLDLEHLAMASAEGQTIKLADLIDNTTSIVEHDRGFAVVYLAEKRALLNVLTKGDPGLQAFALSTLNASLQQLKEDNYEEAKTLF